MKRFAILLIAAVVAVIAYGQNFHAGIYENDSGDKITFYLNGTFQSQLLKGFPLCYDPMDTFDGASARSMIAIGSLSGQYSYNSNNYSVSGTYRVYAGSLDITITNTQGVNKNKIYLSADILYDDSEDEIYIGDDTFRLTERFETERERKAREAREAREYAEWEKQQEAERKAEEARLAKEAKEKAKQWDAVIAAKNKGHFEPFKAEVEKYCQMNISDEEKCKVTLEQADFFRAAGNYSEAMSQCESIISAYGTKKWLDTYTSQAKDRWNEFSAKVIDEAKAAPDALAKFIQVPYISLQNRTAAYDYLREYEFANVVQKEKDFRAVLKLDTLEYNGVKVFDDTYVQKIHEYSEGLRTDSVATLLKCGEERLVANDYHGASQTYKLLLGIDSSNSTARQNLADAELELLKETSGVTIRELIEKCRNYQRNYAYTNSQCLEAGDYCVQMLPSMGPRELNSLIRTIDAISPLTMSDSSRELLLALRKRSQKKVNRKAFGRRMFHGEGNFVGVKFGAGIGGGNSEFGWLADAHLRLGRMCNWFNVVVGGRYVAAKGQDSDKVRGRLTYSQLVIPAELRWNIYHGDECAFYLGAGAEHHLPLQGAYSWRVDGSHADGDAVYKESGRTKEYLAPAYWAPRLAVGITTRYFELELFGSRAQQGKYNTDLLLQEGVDQHIGIDIFDQQTNGRLFIGAAMRLGF